MVVRKMGLCTRHRADLQCSEIELLVIELPTAKVIVGAFYASPNKVVEDVSRLSDQLRTIPREITEKLILIGDFNTPNVDWDVTSVSPPSAKCDHDSQQFKFHLRKQRVQPVMKSRWKFVNGSQAAFVEAVRDARLQDEFDVMTLRCAAEVLDDALVETTYSCQTDPSESL
ncbi:hypothetical protein RvY_13956 [Ramazzottius varieornatus]|uniref:Endonuclease/exonuclease/phosphatase domain-containing protein n=1 Tax=Ramazzottius varieornatus TaxID=947166 RepID=A0A1D1VX19_RAMVA|nr:hypothetical protein RvY_13956 [Ramazzottius varieornatus]